jgi:hypothetical protein
LNPSVAEPQLIAHVITKKAIFAKACESEIIAEQLNTQRKVVEQFGDTISSKLPNSLSKDVT